MDFFCVYMHDETDPIDNAKIPMDATVHFLHRPLDGKILAAPMESASGRSPIHFIHHRPDVLGPSGLEMCYLIQIAPS
jgi:hypothetical protein